jgi:hypothetical protein
MSPFAPPGMTIMDPLIRTMMDVTAPTLLGMLRPSIKDVTTLIPMVVVALTPITSVSWS